MIAMNTVSMPSTVSCLMFHGLISTPSEFVSLRAGFAKAGLTLETPEITGYSYVQGMRPTTWQQWLAEAEKVLLNGSHPLFVGGLCIGALIALALAARHPQRVAGLVLYSPTLYYDGWGLSPWRALRRIGYLPGLRSRIQIAEREPYGVKNEQIRKWIKRDLAKQAVSSAGAARLPLWAIHEAEKLIEYIFGVVAHISAPCLIIHAREDEVTSLRSPEHLMQQLASPRRELLVLENSYHMVTLDNDRQQLLGKTIDFICREAAMASHAKPVPKAAPVTPSRSLLTLN